MKKILFITEMYYPKPQASGICVHEIAKDFVNKGYEVHCLCYKFKGLSDHEVIENVLIYRVKPTFNLRLSIYGEENSGRFLGKLAKSMGTVLIRIKFLSLLPWYPIPSLSTAHRIYKEAEKLHISHNYDMVISSYNPIFSIITGRNMKMNHKDIKFVLYFLDTLSNQMKPFSEGSSIKSIFLNFKRKQNLKVEQSVFEKADLILNLKCHEEHHNAPQYDIYREKMRIVDIPYFTNVERPTQNSIATTVTIQFLYSGSLYWDPSIICKCVLSQEKYNIKLKFRARGPHYNALKKQELVYKNLDVSGFIHPDLLKQIFDETNFFISKGPPGTQKIASKIFLYMATGKPIIHFYNVEDKKTDSAIPYLERYGNALLIENQDDLSVNINKIETFLDSNLGRVVDPSVLEEKFKENYPEYTTETIINFFGDE